MNRNIVYIFIFFLCSLYGIRATFGSREFSGFWVLFLTVWNSNLLRFLSLDCVTADPGRSSFLFPECGSAWGRHFFTDLTFQHFPSLDLTFQCFSSLFDHSQVALRCSINYWEKHLLGRFCLFDLFSDSLWKFILGISYFWFAAGIIFIVVIEYQLKWLTTKLL